MCNGTQNLETKIKKGCMWEKPEIDKVEYDKIFIRVQM